MELDLLFGSIKWVSYSNELAKGRLPKTYNLLKHAAIEAEAPL